jgi:rhodanese-related sulfurtransferase
MKSKVTQYSKYNLFLVLIAVISACDWFGTKNKTATPTAQSSTVQAPLPIKGLILINVNDEASFNEARIKGSINIPFEKIEENSQFLPNETKTWDKNSLLVVYCIDYACSASHTVAKKLKNMGFNNIRIYNGGIQEWYQLGQKDKGTYPYEGNVSKGKKPVSYLTRTINKIESKDEGIPSINAEELSKRLSEAEK